MGAPLGPNLAPQIEKIGAETEVVRKHEIKKGSGTVSERFGLDFLSAWAAQGSENH